MATLSLKISVVGSNAVKTMQFSPSTIVYDACKIIRERVPEANHGNRKQSFPKLGMCGVLDFSQDDVNIINVVMDKCLATLSLVEKKLYHCHFYFPY